MFPFQIVPLEVCGNCVHFRLHYIRYSEHGYSALHYGHCVYPRLKKREPDQTCPYWKARM